MKTYTYSQARQKLARLLDDAGRESCVVIRRRDGSAFLLQPMIEGESPLDVPGVRGTFKVGELVRIVRKERSRSAEKALRAAATRRSARRQR